MDQQRAHTDALGDRGRLEQRVADQRGAQSPVLLGYVNAQPGQNEYWHGVAADALCDPHRRLGVLNRPGRKCVVADDTSGFALGARAGSVYATGWEQGVRSMEIQPRQPSVKAPAETFTGDAWLDVIVKGESPSRIRVSIVRFAPGARNAWHAHAVGQTLHVTDGVGRVQARGGQVIEVCAGDTIYTPPGEWHWHGATPDQFMTHLAMWEAPAEGVETEWGEQVTGEEYLSPAR